MKTLLICSGGLDSVTLGYLVRLKHELSAVLSFNYGQRHQRELDSARTFATSFNVPYYQLDISNVGACLTGSALTDDIDVPDGHYAQEQMKITVVPNRNAIMLTIAYGMAVSQNLDQVALAVHGGDHFIYPDCRPEFIEAFTNMQTHALEGMSDIALYAPFLYKDKTDIVRVGNEINVPFTETWSCYKGGALHCGRCGTCVERREAFDLANINDPTVYEDVDYWKQAIAEARSCS